MNFTSYVICFLGLSVALTEALFLFGKSEPILFCIKVCPLYCKPRSKRDVGPHVGHYFFDAEDETWRDMEEVDWPAPPIALPYYSPYYFCHPHAPKPTTTTEAPKPTTEEPTYICQLCKEKCKYPK